jgi:hypothetical protein
MIDRSFTIIDCSSTAPTPVAQRKLQNKTLEIHFKYPKGHHFPDALDSISPSPMYTSSQATQFD